MPFPQRPAWPSVFLSSRSAFGAQRRVGEEDAGAEPLEELGLLDGDPQVPERDLRVRVGQRERAGGDAGVVVLLRQGARGGLVRGDARREGEAGEGAGREPQPRPQAEDRVEDGARGAGERAPIEGDGIVGAAPASQESHPVGLPLDRCLHSPVDGQDVKGEERRVVRAARPAPREKGRALRHPLGLDEELPEGGVRDVLGDGPQGDLDVARQLDLARPVALIRHGEAPHLGVVLRRDGDLEARLDAVIASQDDGLLGEELHEVVLRLLADGLIGRGPDRAVVDVAQVDELAARVARGVLAPPGDGAAPAEARSAAGVRHDRDVGAVRQDLRARVRRVRRAEAARSASERRGHAGLLGGTRLDDRSLTRHPLLQEELGRLNPRVRVEPVDHDVAEKDVREGDERHPLVVRQVGLDDHAGVTPAPRGAAGEAPPSSGLRGV